MRPTLVRNWTLAGAISGLLGMVVVGGAATLIAVLAPRLEATALLAWALLPGTALAVGLILGLAQWLAARDTLPRLDGESWIGATVASSLVGALLTLTAVSQLTVEPKMTFLLAMALTIGAGAGALLGLFQTLVLRPHVRVGSSWVAINMLGWLLSFGIAFLGLALASTLEAGPGTLIALGAGAVAGTATGLITGPLLLALVDEGRLPPVRHTSEGAQGAIARPFMVAKDGMAG